MLHWCISLRLVKPLALSWRSIGRYHRQRNVSAASAASSPIAAFLRRGCAGPDNNVSRGRHRSYKLCSLAGFGAGIIPGYTHPVENGASTSQVLRNGPTPPSASKLVPSWTITIIISHTAHDLTSVPSPVPPSQLKFF
jgi:hypothetical protein